MDRFEQGLPDPQEAEVIDYCPCGGEIYVGQNVVRKGNELYCSFECLAGSMGAVTIMAGEEEA